MEQQQHTKKNGSRRETYLEKERPKWPGNKKECSVWIGSKFIIKIMSGVVKSTCSWRRLRFGSQHFHLISQPPIIQVPGNMKTSSDLQQQQPCTQNTYTHADKTLLHTKWNKSKILHLYMYETYYFVNHILMKQLLK